MSNLNASYYGPSIPPPSKPYHRPKPSSSCNPLSCLCGCCFNLIFKLLFTILFNLALIIALLLFLFWLAFRPNTIKFHVTDAALTQFNLTTAPNPTLYYNLALNLTIRNPNKHIGIYYDAIEARAFYGGQRFAVSTPPGFYQGEKNTTELNVVLKGQNVVVVGQGKKNDVLSDYDSEKASGVYRIDVKLYLVVRFRLRRFIKTPRLKPKIECDLKVPLRSNSNGTASGSGSAFEATKCGLDW